MPRCCSSKGPGEDGRPARFTYVAGLTEQGTAVVAKLVGTAAQIPDGTIDDILATFQLALIPAHVQIVDLAAT